MQFAPVRFFFDAHLRKKTEQIDTETDETKTE